MGEEQSRSRGQGIWGKGPGKREGPGAGSGLRDGV